MEKKKKGGAHLRKRKFNILPAVLGAAAVVIIAGGFAFFAVSAARCTTVMPNVYVCGEAVGGMTRDEALEKISASVAQPMLLSVQSDAGEELARREISPLALMGGVSADELADMAYAYGRDGGFFGNTLSYIGCIFGRASVMGGDVAAGFEDRALSGEVSALVAELGSSGIDSTYTIKDEVLTMIKGAGGLQLSENEAFNAVLAAFKAGEREAVCRAEYIPAEKISLKSIYDKVYREPKNAEFDEDFTVIPGQTGLSFDLEAAQKEYDAAENGSVVAVPIIQTEPEVTDESLSSLIFRDRLGSWTSSLTNNATRSKNIELAAAEVNEKVVMPGEVFSFNDTVGERTTERGFGGAPAYIGGQTVDQVGGGICQVSSSIYYCCLYADLEIVYRTCHLYAASYVPLGMDATVSWGGPDFKFRNSSEYPVKILAWRDGDKLYCELYGTKTTDEYIDMTYEVTDTYNFGIKYKEDASIASGQTKNDVSGITGYRVNTYKARYAADGTLLSREREATSNYSCRDRVILVAPGELYLYDPSVPAPVIAPEEPEPTTEPSTEPSTEPAAEEAPLSGEQPGEGEAAEQPEDTSAPTAEPSPEPTAEPVEIAA